MVYVVVPVVAAAGVVGVIMLVRRARGKSLAILGPRKAGKTTLATFLASGEIPRGYKPTVLRATKHGRQRVPGSGRRLPRGIKMKDVALKLTMGDTPGMTPHGDLTNYRIWQESAKDADVICYVVDIAQLRQKRYREVALNGARHVARWDNATSRRLLILTHTDLDPSWTNGDPDEISGRAEVAELRRNLKAENVIMGSLKDVEGARELAFDLLQVLAQ